MGYEQDFILRMAKRIGEVLARALGLAKANNYEDSLQVLEQGVGDELGIPFAMLLRLEPASAVRLLGKEKAQHYAEALRTRALLLGMAGRDQDAAACRELAESVATASA